MTGATVEFDNREALAAIAAAANAMGNPAPMLRDMGEYLLIAHDQHFAQQRAPDGTAWQALSPRYKARKKKNRDKLLRLDGYLSETLRYQVGGDELLFGSNRIYAAAQHFGFPKRRLPARPFLGTRAEDDAELIVIAQDYLQRAMAGARA